MRQEHIDMIKHGNDEMERYIIHYRTPIAFGYQDAFGTSPEEAAEAFQKSRPTASIIKIMRPDQAIVRGF